MRRRTWVLLGLVVVAVASVAGPDFYYRSSSGRGCSRCHEIGDQYRAWTGSAHRGVKCDTCHDSSVMTNVRRVVAHVRDQVPEQPRLKGNDVFAMVERCRSCHQEEFAAWQAGPHRITYSEVFLDKKHNTGTRLRRRLPALPRHALPGEHRATGWARSIGRGRGKLVDESVAQRPAIPCLTCHSIHREGSPLHRAKEGRPCPGSAPGDGASVARPVRSPRAAGPYRWLRCRCLSPLRARASYGSVQIPDRRSAINATHRSRPAKSARATTTPQWVSTRGSVAWSAISVTSRPRRHPVSTCHPKLSNCGLDVEKMDTTFLNPDSRHNIHTVKCADCHPKGIPQRKRKVM